MRNILISLLSRRIKWFNPRKTTVLVVDSHTGDFFSKIAPVFDVESFNMRDYIYINLRLFLYLFYGKLSLSSIKDRYMKYVVFSYAPDYTISFSDSRACSMSVFSDNKYMSGVVQIGLRGSLAEKFSSYCLFNHYYCFGENVKNYFIKNGAKIKEYKIIGSVKNNHYWHALRDSNSLPDKQYDVCLLSSYRNSQDKESAEYINFVSMIKMMIQLTEDRGAKCAIIIHHDKITAQATMKILSLLDTRKSLYLLVSDWDYGSYFNLEKGRILLSSGTTLGHEAFSQGKRILFYNFTEDRDFDFPSRGASKDLSIDKVLLKKNCYSMLCDMIEYIANVSNEKWEYLVNKIAKKEIYFDDRNNPNCVLIDDIMQNITL